MLLSSGVVWRHRELDDFRAECPGGDPALQRLIVERLDDALDWLEPLGAEPVLAGDGQPAHRRRRFEPRALTEALVRAAGDVRLAAPFREAASRSCSRPAASPRGWRAERGAAPARGAVERRRRARVGLARGAAETGGMERVLRARDARAGPLARTSTCAPRSSTRATRSCSTTRAVISRDAAWHESDIVQRCPAAGVVRRRCTGAARPVRERTVARARRGAARPGATSPAESCRSRSRVAEAGEPPCACVYAGVTHTIGGLRDRRSRARARRDGSPIRPLRGGRRCRRDLHRRLRQRARAALVFGRIAAETALG